MGLLKNLKEQDPSVVAGKGQRIVSKPDRMWEIDIRQKFFDSVSLSSPSSERAHRLRPLYKQVCLSRPRGPIVQSFNTSDPRIKLQGWVLQELKMGNFHILPPYVDKKLPPVRFCPSSSAEALWSRFTFPR